LAAGCCPKKLAIAEKLFCLTLSSYAYGQAVDQSSVPAETPENGVPKSYFGTGNGQRRSQEHNSPLVIRCTCTFV